MNDKPVSSTSAALTDSRLAALCAHAVRESFLEYEKQFHEITRGARERFLAGIGPARSPMRPRGCTFMRTSWTISPPRSKN